MNCEWCGEALEASEAFERAPRFHRECMIRMVLGSVEHMTRQCGCFQPAHMACEEPTGLTLREAARQSYAKFQEIESRKTKAGLN